MEGLQPFLDKMKIVFKEHCNKWGYDRYHYGIKIGDEVFNYYGSNKDFEDERKCIDVAIHNYGVRDRFKRVDYTDDKLANMGAKYLGIKIPTTEKILTDVLYALVQDYWTYENYDMGEFIDEFGHSGREGIKIYKELENNYNRMKKVFTSDELNKLREMFEDY